MAILAETGLVEQQRPHADRYVSASCGVTFERVSAHGGVFNACGGADHRLRSDGGIRDSRGVVPERARSNSGIQLAAYIRRQRIAAQGCIPTTQRVCV